MRIGLLIFSILLLMTVSKQENFHLIKQVHVAPILKMIQGSNFLCINVDLGKVLVLSAV